MSRPHATASLSLSCLNVCCNARKSSWLARVVVSNDSHLVWHAFLNVFATTFLLLSDNTRDFKLICTFRYIAVRFGELSKNFQSCLNQSSTFLRERQKASRFLSSLLLCCETSNNFLLAQISHWLCLLVVLEQKPVFHWKLLFPQRRNQRFHMTSLFH